MSEQNEPLQPDRIFRFIDYKGMCHMCSTPIVIDSFLGLVLSFSGYGWWVLVLSQVNCPGCGQNYYHTFLHMYTVMQAPAEFYPENKISFYQPGEPNGK